MDHRPHALPDRLEHRIRGEYLEMPGLSLNGRQAQRLFGADEGLCLAILDSLVDSGFLYRRRDGTYARHTGVRRTSTMRGSGVEAGKYRTDSPYEQPA